MRQTVVHLDKSVGSNTMNAYWLPFHGHIAHYPTQVLFRVQIAPRTRQVFFHTVKSSLPYLGIFSGAVKETVVQHDIVSMLSYPIHEIGNHGLPVAYRYRMRVESIDAKQTDPSVRLTSRFHEIPYPFNAVPLFDHVINAGGIHPSFLGRWSELAVVRDIPSRMEFRFIVHHKVIRQLIDAMRLNGNTTFVGYGIGVGKNVAIMIGCNDIIVNAGEHNFGIANESKE